MEGHFHWKVENIFHRSFSRLFMRNYLMYYHRDTKVDQRNGKCYLCR